MPGFVICLRSRACHALSQCMITAWALRLLVLLNGQCEGPCRRTSGVCRLPRFFNVHTPLRGSRVEYNQWLMKPIGELIKEEIRSQERSITWFARKLCIDRSNVYRLFQKNSVDTDLLARISLALDKNFFDILAQRFEERRNSQQN